MFQYCNYVFNAISKNIIKSKTPLYLSNFTQLKTINNDSWNNIPNGEIHIEFYDKLNNNRYAGFINYRNYVGQVGVFVLTEQYRNRGLGKQILTQTIKDMKEHKCTLVWAVTIQGHAFWSNVYGKKFKWADKLHPSVSGDGYIMEID